MSMKVTRCEFVHNLPCEQVSNRLTELEAENGKLREERDMYRDLVGMMDHPDLNTQLQAENAKLRELVKDTWRLLYHWLFKAKEVPYREMKAVYDRMRELGVEVDG